MATATRTVIYRWASQETAEGYNGTRDRSSLYFVGRVLYSYGEHFPLAIAPSHPDEPVYLNRDTYSVTTSKQQSWTASAVHSYFGGHLVERVDTDTIRRIAQDIRAAFPA